jgi:2-polyprenyl-3-methyl-5-hydroxy-6-metoxy-1,4-benzoquinol methylase
MMSLADHLFSKKATEQDPRKSAPKFMPPEELRVALPEPNIQLDQDSEWCLVERPEGWQEIRFHDYGEIYEIPGLYEKLFYEILQCDSPALVCQLLAEHMRGQSAAPASLRVLDLGAGNGIVGQELARIGVSTVVGVDIVEQARTAAMRDRPDVYTDYLIEDMTDLPEQARRRLESFRFNCLTCVAALGFGDIPSEAFVRAYELVEPGGFVAFNIKKDFLDGQDLSGFAELMRSMIDENILEVSCTKAYPHRLATKGDPIEYVAIVGTKRAEVPVAMLAS